MSDKFMSYAADVATGTNKTLLSVFQSAASPVCRPRVYHLILGCSQTPADIAGQFAFARITALGTEGSGRTPIKLDAGSPAANCDTGVGVFSVEPTFGDYLLPIPLNQRSTFQWIAVPGAEFVLTATQNYGAAMRSIAMSSGTEGWDTTFYWEE